MPSQRLTAPCSARPSVHDRGAVVSTSVGASIMSEFMISMGDEGITPRQRTSQLSAGLGLISGVIIDQHFGQRARYGRLMSMVAGSPNLIGIGIDEDTAIEVVDRRTFTVQWARRGVRAGLPHRRLRRPGGPSGCSDDGVGGGRALAARGRYVRSPRRAADRVRREAPGRRRDAGQQPGPTSAPVRPQGDPMAPERLDPDRPGRAELTIVESRIYRGGNIWSYDPAIHLVLDLGVLEGYLTDTLDGFTDRLIELLPGLENHTCSRGVKGGFIERLREGTWLGHVTEHVALQLQQEAGHDIRRARPGPSRALPAITTSSTAMPTRPSASPRNPRRPPGQPPGAGRGGLRLQ